MILPERVLGRSSDQMMRLGRASLPILLGDVVADLGDEVVGAFQVAFEGDEGGDRLAGVLVGLADHGGLGDLGVGDDRRLDLGGAHAMPGHVEDVVDAADDPEVAVGVLAGGVADEVRLGPELLPVGGDEALVVAIQRAQHPRPRLRQRQQALGVAVDLLAGGLVDDAGG